LKLSRRQVDHEDVVAEAYVALRRAALYLTRGDEAEAGDLVHDTFVRFLLLRPPLDAIGNLDGYLYTMLRNVYLSRQRRHVRRKAVVVETIDVDLLAVMVDEPEPDERLRMRDDLMRLVDHARERTRVSRAASAWLLRCVHGYYPAEIARVMKMPPRAVDRALHVARREALEELRKPSRRRRDRDGGAGSSVGAGAAARLRWRDLHVGMHGSHDGTDGIDGPEGAEPLDTLQALRVRLFASVDGACLTNDQVAELYRPSSGGGADADPDAHADGDAAGNGGGDGDRSDADSIEPAGTLLMAHVVACAGCLDRINHHLDLPPLKTRDPVESSGTRRRRGGESGGPGGAGGPGRPDGPAGAGRVEPHGEAKGGSASRGGAGLEPLLRRTRDTIASIVDHVPRELRIAANGLELGALPVAGVVTVQELAVRLAESLAFVEIFDERGALVCYWPAQVPREGMLDDDITIELPDGRSIELRVSLMDDCPRLRVRYTDERQRQLGRRRRGRLRGWRQRQRRQDRRHRQCRRRGQTSGDSSLTATGDLRGRASSTVVAPARPLAAYGDRRRRAGDALDDPDRPHDHMGRARTSRTRGGRGHSHVDDVPAARPPAGCRAASAANTACRDGGAIGNRAAACRSARACIQSLRAVRSRNGRARRVTRCARRSWRGHHAARDARRCRRARRRGRRRAARLDHPRARRSGRRERERSDSR
jgi:RNA polymerase sigma factor (sigma-70 family)